MKFIRFICATVLLVWFLDYDASGAFAEVVTTKTAVIEVAPTVDTNAYASGDLIGGKLTLSNATAYTVYSGIISNVVIIDKDKEALDIDVVFFDTNPTATTFTDNAAFTPNDTDLLNIICTVSITTDVAFADNGMSYANNVNCPFKTPGTNTIYAALVARGAGTYTSSSDLLLRVGILQD